MTPHLFRTLLVYPLAVALLPAVFIPFLQIQPDVQKGTLAAIFLGIALCAAALSLIGDPRRPSLVPPTAAWAGLLLLVAASLSALVRGDSFFAYAGTSFETGTVGFFGLFAAAMALGSLLNRTHIRLVLAVFAASALVAAASFFAVFISGAGGMGTWPHLSFIVAAALVVCVAQAGAMRHRSSALMVTGAVFLSAAFALLFHPVAALTAAGALALLAVMRGLQGGRALAAVPALAAAFLCAATIFGFSSLLTLPPDARLTVGATLDAGADAYLALPGALLGAGPNSFGIVWEKYRPEQFNLTPLWNSTFSEGYSTLITWLVTLGFVGIFAVLMLFVSLGYSVWNAALLGEGRGLRDGDFVASLILALFVLLAAAVYAASVPLLLMGGLCIGFCARLSSPAPREVMYGLRKRLIRTIPLLCAGLFVGGLGALQLYAGTLHGWGLRAFENQDIAQARQFLGASARTYPVSPYLRDASRASLEAARALASTPGTEDRAIRSVIAEARSFAGEASERYPREYETHLSEASLLTSLAIAGATDGAAQARESLRRAQQRSPTRPEIPYIEAVLSEAEGNFVAARVAAQDALRLKPDYAPAIALQQRLGSGEE